MGLKQTLANPWQAFAAKSSGGSEVEGEVKNKTEFGLFIGLEGEVDGMVHLSDLDWNKPGEQTIEEFKKGDMRARPRSSMSTSRRSASRSASSSSAPIPSRKPQGEPFAKPGEEEPASGRARSSLARCSTVKDGGIDVKIAGTDFTAFIKRTELARDRAEQRTERFAVGEKVDARVTVFDRRARKVSVSIKALEVAEEKEAIAQYGSADSGASLGDILGAALKAREDGEPKKKKAAEAGESAEAAETAEVADTAETEESSEAEK